MSNYPCHTCRGDSPCCWENPATWERTHRQCPEIDGPSPFSVRCRWALRWLNGLARRHKEFT